MSALAVDAGPFDFSYPYASVEDFDASFVLDPELDACQDTQNTFNDDGISQSPPTMPAYFDPSILNFSYVQQQQQQQHQHTGAHDRSSSQSSVYSSFSAVDSVPDTTSTRFSTPPRISSPIRNHGPLLLPKIRPHDQDAQAAKVAASIPRKRRAKAFTTPPAKVMKRQPSVQRHVRSYTNPEGLSRMAYAHLASFETPTPMSYQQQQQQPDDSFANSLLCSPVSFIQNTPQSDRRASTCSTAFDVGAMGLYGYTALPQQAFSTSQLQPTIQDMTQQASFSTKADTPLSVSSTPEPVTRTASHNLGYYSSASTSATNTLRSYLTAPNPASSLVRTLSFPHRDPNLKHFWWDVRSVQPWTAFTPNILKTVPNFAQLLDTPVPASLLPPPPAAASSAHRHPETEAALHALHAHHYLPKLNAALAISSADPVQFSLSSSSHRKNLLLTSSDDSKPTPSSAQDLVFTASTASDMSSAASLFGGKPIARIVGLTRSFERFNTGMRNEGNIKKVEYLRGLAALQHQMRQHSTRYGFILTEIELVLVCSGSEAVPYFGHLDVTSIQLAATVSPSSQEGEDEEEQNSDTSAASSSPPTMTACLALFSLAQLLASDDPPRGFPHWKADIGPPAEGTRRKAEQRDGWVPQPQLAEKRQAKRSRGWVWPEDAVGRKELGKRGVRYHA